MSGWSSVASQNTGLKFTGQSTIPSVSPATRKEPCRPGMVEIPSVPLVEQRITALGPLKGGLPLLKQAMPLPVSRIQMRCRAGSPSL